MKNITQKTWSEEELLDFRGRLRAVTIPINNKVGIEQTALHLNRIFDIIRSAEKMAVANCVCREKLQNCDYPLKVCLSIDKHAKRLVTEGEAEFISKAEAEKIMKETNQQGLVHLTLHKPDEDDSHIQEICSCCSCCCHALASKKGLSLVNMEKLIKPSKFISTHDPEECINCGDCVQRCHFQARILSEENIMTFNPNYCFGCGLCVTSCSQNAIEMIER